MHFYFLCECGDVFLLILVKFKQGFWPHLRDGFNISRVFFLREGEKICFLSFLAPDQFVKHLKE